MPGRGIFQIGVVLSVLLSISGWGTVAYAAKKDTQEKSGTVTFNIIPTFYVKSDGQHYTELSRDKHPLLAWNAIGRFIYDAPDNDRIKSYDLQLRMEWEAAGQSEKYLGSHVSHSYVVGDRPKKIDKDVSFSISSDIEPFVVGACNATAAGFRKIGQSNKQIFSHQHNVNAMIYASHAIDIQRVPPNSFAVAYVYKERHAKIVCMPAPKAQVDAATNLQAASAVTQASLSILEQSTLGGACKVNLATVIQTNLPNTKVKFRFEHSSGKKSKVKTVTTSQSKTAMKAYWYNIPNNPNGPETGKIRMVGVNFNFTSAWKDYDMSCHAAGPGSLSKVVKPTVKLDVKPVNFMMKDGLRCPRQVDITTSITSQKAFHGSGVITVKQGNLGNATHDVNVQPYLVWKKTDRLDLKPWGHTGGGNNTFQAQPGSNTNQMFQRFEVRYVLSANQKPVITTPFKTVVIRCTGIKVNPQVAPTTNGLTTPANPGSSPAGNKTLQTFPTKPANGSKLQPNPTLSR